MLDLVRKLKDAGESGPSLRMRSLLNDDASAEGPLGTDNEEPSQPPPALTLSPMNFSKKTGKYTLRAEGGLLFVDARKLKGSIDSRVGQIAPATILNFRNSRIGILSPIVLDLDGDGVELRDRKKTKAKFDMDGDGVRDDTGWVGRNDGLLVIDRNGDGRITSASEISFLTENPKATSDLDALAGLDSNRDNVIDASDRRFLELKVWVDRNGNGISDPGELKSLADHGIQSISLLALSSNSKAKLGSNMVLATSTFTRTDGSVGTVGDVALAFRPSSKQEAAAAEGGLDDVRSDPNDQEPRNIEEMFRGFDTAPRLFQGSSQHGEVSEPLDARAAPASVLDTGIASGGGDDFQASGRGAPGRESLFPDHPPESEYLSKIGIANARLIQALSSFGEGAAMADTGKQSLVDVFERPEWLTVAALPSVASLLAVR